MSRTPLAYRPNPDGWIDTSSASRNKPPTQRPLTALRHNLGIATPPPSTFRQPRSKPKNETPLARQSNLAAYMTPPTTGSGKVAVRHRGLQKALREVDTETKTPTTGDAGRAVREKRSEDYWMLDAEPGPSQLLLTPSAEQGLRGKEVNADLEDDNDDGLISPGGKRIRRMDYTTSQPIRSSLLPAPRSRVPDLDEDMMERRAQGGNDIDDLQLRDTTPERLSELGSDLPERTPIPSSVLAMHKRLCHQNSSGTKRIRSPWRPHGDSSPIRPKRVPVRSGQEKRDEVDDRARAIRNKENRKRELAVLSDEEDLAGPSDAKVSTASRRSALQTLKPNVGRKQTQQPEKRFVTGFASPRNRLRPASSTSDVPSEVAEPDRKRHKRARSVQDEPHRHLRAPKTARSPHVAQGNHRPSGSSSDGAPPSPLDRKARPRSTSRRPGSPTPEDARARVFEALEVDRPPTTTPPRVVTPAHIFGQSTPRKHRLPTSIHHVTPTKLRSPKAMQSTNETLFAFSPPPQPRFPPADDKAEKAWQPVTMDAETLITWAPAGWAETMEQLEQARASSGEARQAPGGLADVADEGFAEAEQDVGGAEIVRPHPTPLQGQKHARSGSSTSETESLAPSELSQSFPNFVHSSPTKRSRLIRAAEPSQCATEGSKTAPEHAADDAQARQEPPARQSESNAATTTPRRRRATPHAKGAAERWGKLHEGILSVPVNQTPTRAQTPSSGTQGSKPKSARGGDAQLKLAAFGYFPSGKSGKGKRETSRNFDRAWSDEEDLQLEPEEDNDEAPGPSSSPAAGGGPKRLRSVPDAPYHPGLRPAGVAELKRRRRESQRQSPSRPRARERESSVVDNDGGVASKVERDVAAPSSSSMGPSSSSQSEDLFPGFSGGDDDPRQWLDQIGHRRSSEFRSFRSEDECDLER